MVKKEKTKIVGNWHELVEFIESINPNKETICLSGWINELYDGRTYIRRLCFTTKDIEILKRNMTKKKRDRLKKSDSTR